MSQNETRPATDAECPPKPPAGLNLNPIFAHLGAGADDARHITFIYGYISSYTGKTVRFYQDLALDTYYEVNCDEVVYAEPDDPTSPSSLTKLVVFDDARITRFKKKVATWTTAGELADAVAAENELRENIKSLGVIKILLHKWTTSSEGATAQSDSAAADVEIDPKELSCHPPCRKRNGECICPVLLKHEKIWYPLNP